MSTRSMMPIVLVTWALIGVPATPAKAQSSAAAPAPAAAVNVVDEIAIQPGDMLRIAIWPDASFGGEFVVEESGYVYLPFLGPVYAAGVSLDTLRNRLREGYSGAMKNAVITITPVFTVGVLGEVQRPGLYQVTPANTLFDVIGMAGGFGEQADQRRVRVVREGEVVRVNTELALQRGQGLHALALRSGDQIIVEKRSGFRLADARNVVFALQSVILLLNVFNRF